jgi:hypothetical protein
LNSKVSTIILALVITNCFILGNIFKYGSDLHATTSGTLIVNKEIDNQAQQSVSIDDFVITVRDGQGNEIGRQTAEEGGNEFAVPAGDYSVDEIGPSGVISDPQRSSGCSGTMTGGDQVTCSITNVIKSIFIPDGDVVPEGDVTLGESGVTGANETLFAYIEVVSTCEINNETCSERAFDDLSVWVQPFTFEDNEYLNLGTGFPASSFGRIVQIPIFDNSTSIQYEIKQTVLGVEGPLLFSTIYSPNCHGEIKANEKRECTISLNLYM